MGREAAAGAVNAAFGLALLYVAAPRTQTFSPLLAGWLGMVGLILAIHFGMFQVMAGLWHRAGVKVTPLMNAPLTAVSLGEFWGRRWNTGFSLPARRYLLQPLARRIGVARATLVVFLVSGLVHELVISVPAGRGYGLPTAYFLLQGFGALFERSTVGRRSGLGKNKVGRVCPQTDTPYLPRPWRRRVFTFVWVAGPAFWLFHPAFVERVMIPFLKTIGALKGISS
jgi:alginate O-acetyltransferase complex protein AlgI